MDLHVSLDIGVFSDGSAMMAKGAIPKTHTPIT